MLVLTRKLGEKLLIGEDIVITLLDVRGDSVRLGIDAPRGITIARAEVIEAVSAANIAAVQTDAATEEQIKNMLGHAFPGKAT
ncbi:MAG: carbon storage regulator CsrA [Actinomycetota bacterium]|uniref:carbon storage regulator CsrA n=1 Tax=Micrococcaceae TaxID=1268 RepID=UPI0024B97CC8|nr:carbon storage regulator CsrA [Paenarthrobacter sp. PH39-S1]MDJ0356018.1 carbon storage regulator CsrA [Paenarthrobacter sp. PH39-S1]MDQ6740383.1 carbon storage regulator CsrA [Actinomycetota bacterium]